MPEIGVYPFRDGLVTINIFDADTVRVWHADTALPIPLDSLDRWHVGGFRVPPEATSVRLRIEVDGIATLATATWPKEEDRPIPKPKRERARGKKDLLRRGQAGK